MEVKDKVVVVTGGASGIGRALCERFAAEGAAGVVVADLQEAGAREVAESFGGIAVRCDVSVESDVQSLVAAALQRFGRIDVFCANAGIGDSGSEQAPDDVWNRHMGVNFMGHVYAARAVVPGMLEQGGGAFVVTASAAGLLTQIGSAPYTASKFAAVGFAEWLAITYGDDGLRVACVCPQGVITGMLNEDSGPAFLLRDAVQASDVAEAVVEALRNERFLVLPHPEVRNFQQAKAEDPDRWIASMRKLQKKIAGWRGL